MKEAHWCGWTYSGSRPSAGHCCAPATPPPPWPPLLQSMTNKLDAFKVNTGLHAVGSQSPSCMHGPSRLPAYCEDASMIFQSMLQSSAQSSCQQAAEECDDHSVAGDAKPLDPVLLLPTSQILHPPWKLSTVASLSMLFRLVFLMALGFSS